MKMILIDMPFSLPECASFGLTQIKTYLDIHKFDMVQTDILYLNHEFIDYFGEDFYKVVNADFYDYYKFDSNKHLWVDKLRKSGLEVDYFGGMLGDWVFRQEAFPETDDNTELYFENYYKDNIQLKEFIKTKRSGLKKHLISIIKKYNLTQYDIIGFSCKFQQQVASLALANIIKSLKSNIITIMGGPNCEPPAGATIAACLNSIDYIFSGRRFLIGMGKFIDYVANGNLERVETIPGLFSKNKALNVNGADPYEESEEDDITKSLELNYDSYFDSIKSFKIDKKVSPILFLETSRGCSWGEKERCSFCAIDGYNPKHRMMQSSDAIYYINTVLEKYNNRCKYFVFVDSTLPKNYLYEVFPYINIPKDTVFLYETRVDFTEKEIELMARYHIKLLITGIESISTDTLKLLNKGTTAFDNIRFLKSCRKFGIAVNWNILVGIPGETDELLKENLNSIKYISHLYPPTGVWLVSFQGNCDYNINEEKYNITLEHDIDSLSLIYPFEENTLKNMTYFKKRISSDLSKTSAISIHKLSKAALKWKERWFNSDESNLPNLTFSRDFKKIIDTREEIKKEILLDETSLSILLSLKTEKSTDELCELTKLEKRVLQSYIEKFMTDHLIFIEHDKMISLVLD